MKKQVEKILLYTTIITEQDKEHAKESLISHGYNPAEMEEQNVLEWASEYKNTEFDDLMLDFDNIDTAGYKIIAVADGQKDCKVYDRLKQVFYGHYDDIEIYLLGDILCFNGHNDDGTDYIKVYLYDENKDINHNLGKKILDATLTANIVP